MISINFDSNVLMAQRNVNIASNYVNEALQRLTTGFRINSSADDPAGYYFASNLNTDLRAFAIAQQNIADGVNFLTTAQDSLFHMGDIVNRLRDLAMQGSSGVLDSAGRKNLQDEADALLEELFRLRDDSEFNDINVFGANEASSYALSLVSAGSPPPHTAEISTIAAFAPSLAAGNAGVSTLADIEVTVMQGSNSGLTEDILVLGGSIEVASGGVIDAAGKTLGEIAQEINAQGNVTASVEDGKFTIKSENGEVNIIAEGDFARISGMGNYTVSAATISNTISANRKVIQQGQNSSLKGTEQILNGTIKIGNGAQINAKGLSVNNVITLLNNQKQEGVTVSIKNGKFTITSKNGVDILVTGDIARVTGLADYEVEAGTSITDTPTNIVLQQGANDKLIGNENILSGTIKINNGAEISTKGKTLNTIISEINSQGQFGISAFILNGKFTIQSREPVTITATGDFARVTGLDNYTVTASTTTNGESVPTATTKEITIQQGSATNLTGFETVIGGTVQINSGAEISTNGKTLNEIVLEINRQGSGVTASVTEGKFTIKSDSSATINATGDFARITGLGSYTVSQGTQTTTPEGTTALQGSLDTRDLADAAFHGQKNGTITFSDGTTVSVSMSDSRTDVLTDIQNKGITVEIDENGKIVLSKDGVTDLSITSDTSGFCAFYGLLSTDTTYTATVTSTQETISESKFIQVVDQITSDSDIPTGYTAIYTADDLNNIRNNLYGKYILMADIDLSSITNWVPIGTSSSSFRGTFDGNGHVIKNLNIDKTSNYTGLFGYTSGAKIQNLGLENVNVKGSDYTGGLVGYSNNTNIYNCYVSGSVQGNEYTGMLVGYFESGYIAFTHTSGNVESSGTSTGGSVGEFSSGMIEKSFSEVNVKTTFVYPNGVLWAEYIGGLIGVLSSGTVANCYSTGSLTGRHEGGLVGYGNSYKIKNSYTTSGNSIIGRTSSNSSSMTDCYANTNPSNFTNWDTDIWDLSGSRPLLKAPTTKSSTITGSVDTRNTSGSYTAFYGSQNGTVTFSDGTEVFISGGYSDVIDTLKIYGFDAGIDANGKIYITKYGVSDLTIVSDTSGFSEFYGLMPTGKTYTGNMTSTEKSVDELYKGDFSQSIYRLTEADAISQGYTVIKTVADFEAIKNNLSGKYILMNDIDFSSVQNWTAIGDYTGNFTGKLNGNGYVIKNLNSDTGIFSVVQTTAIVENLGLENININNSTDQNIGTLANNNYGTISNCYVKNSQIVSTYVNTSYIGGLVGKNTNNGYIAYSYAKNCTITKDIGTSSIGGLVGELYSGEINTSFADCNIITTGDVGGLVGTVGGYHVDKVIIRNSYTLGSVMSTNGYAGGLIGDAGASYACCEIYNSYSTTSVNGTKGSGGIVGIRDDWSSASYHSVYWDAEKTGCLNYSGESTSTSDSALTTEEMSQKSSFAGWADSIWDFSGTAPTLIDTTAAAPASSITGSVDTRNFSDKSFSGQQSGTLELSDGTTINIKSTDSRTNVLTAIRNAGYFAQTNAEGKIVISKNGISNLSIVSDSSGFSDFYGLMSNEKVYTGGVNETVTGSDKDTATITGSVSTGNLADNYFYGQKDGQLSFSNGVNVSINATDTRSDVLQKINDAGLQAQVGADGKIQITAQGVSDLTVTSDSSGFSDFYGLDGTESSFNGSISTSTETIPDPDGGDVTDPDGGDGGSTTDPGNPDNPPLDIAGLVTHDVSNIRLQIGKDGSDLSALYCDTTFIFDDFSLDFSDEDSCANSLEALEAFSDAVIKKQSDIGIYITRLESIYQSNSLKIQNTYSAYSTVMDADIAQETQKYVYNQIRQQTASSLLAQIQASRTQMVMTLLSSIM